MSELLLSVNRPSGRSSRSSWSRGSSVPMVKGTDPKMPRSTFFVILKYAIFVNWTLYGFWIIYNSTDYSLNAHIITGKLTSNSDDIDERRAVIYGLIAYTVMTSFVSFFGLVGVCYENFYITLGLAACYAIYIVGDAIFNVIMGVPFTFFLGVMYTLLSANCLALFLLAFMIRGTKNFRYTITSAERVGRMTKWRTGAHHP
ncbi:hypothetical protein HDE_04882 [Halotydeus destructor]|nr:hypothetical protein HDE_04882 [Halotydeus destructor]